LGSCGVPAAKALQAANVSSMATYLIVTSRATSAAQAERAG
jgi:hypothetical protein